MCGRYRQKQKAVIIEKMYGDIEKVVADISASSCSHTPMTRWLAIVICDFLMCSSYVVGRLWLYN